MPRQMPSSGTPSAARARIGPASPRRSISLIASGNAPTPGRTSDVAAAISAGSELTAAAAPTCSNALTTERMLPMP